jgi:hypothetical protein
MVIRSEEERQRVVKGGAGGTRDADGVGGVPLGCALGREAGEEAEEGGAGVGVGAASACIGDEVVHPGRDDRLEQRLLAGEVTVHGAGSDAGAGGDVVQRDGAAGLGERVPGGVQDALSIPPGVGAQRWVRCGHC